MLALSTRPLPRHLSSPGLTPPRADHLNPALRPRPRRCLLCGGRWPLPGRVSLFTSGCFCACVPVGQKRSHIMPGLPLPATDQTHTTHTTNTPYTPYLCTKRACVMLLFFKPVPKSLSLVLISCASGRSSPRSRNERSRRLVDSVVVARRDHCRDRT